MFVELKLGLFLVLSSDRILSTDATVVCSDQPAPGLKISSIQCFILSFLLSKIVLKNIISLLFVQFCFS